MDNPSPEDLQLNIEDVKEAMATLILKLDKSSLLLYGNKDIHFPGMVEDVEVLKAAIKNINGMPKQVKELKEAVGSLVETDKKRVNFIRGAIAGYGLLTTGVGAILIKVFS